MGFRAFVLLGLLFAIVLISSEVSARELAETEHIDETNGVEESKYPYGGGGYGRGGGYGGGRGGGYGGGYGRGGGGGGGYGGGYGRGGGGGYGGGYGGGRGGGGGGRCGGYGCCGGGGYGCRCCTSAAEAEAYAAKQAQAKPEN